MRDDVYIMPFQGLPSPTQSACPAGTREFSFTTIDATPPHVTTYQPELGAIVSASSATEIVLAFNEAIQASCPVP